MKETKETKEIKPTVRALILISITLVIIIVASLVGYKQLKESNEIEPQAVNDIINEQEIEESQVEVEESTITPHIMARNAPINIANGVATEVDPYKIIETEIELLKSKDIATVQKYFGVSDVFTPEDVADKLTATAITFISSEEIEDGTRVVIHVCTLDYDKMKVESDKLKLNTEGETEAEKEDNIKKELAKGIIKEQFDVHFNIPVIIKNNFLEVSEALKQAITGNWYHGVNIELQGVDCPISK